MKILIVNNNMAIGGIQKSLVNLINEISKKHDVSLLLFNPSGALMKDINENVKILKGNCFTTILGMSQKEAKENGIFTFLWRSFWVILSKIFGSGFSYKLLSGFQKINEEFDAAISYMQNSANKTFYGGCNEFVLGSVNAQRKISFVHCDMKNYEGNNPYNISLYKRFDAVACVSHSCKKIFDEVAEGINSYCVHNMYDFSSFEKLSKESEITLKEGKNIFTSARISEEKGILRMIPIFEKIKKDGGKFTWYIAGDGPLREKAEEMKSSAGLENEIIFLGLLKNPYPYFKHSDMVLVPSYNEAAPMVYGEALYFKTPVFTTDTTSAHEIIGNENGWVCENNDEAIYENLKNIILNGEPLKTVKAELSNEKAASEFEKLLVG